MTEGASKAPEKSEKASTRQSDSAKRAPRLPPYYAAVVTDEQRPKLAAVQTEFADQIKEKREELRKLVKKQDSALRKLLNPKQREQLDKLRSEALARRQASDPDADGEMLDQAAGDE